MKVLFTCVPGYGHLHPLLPLAQALHRAVIQPDRCDAPTLREAVNRILGESSYRDAARRVRRSIDSMPWPESYVDRLQTLATRAPG